MRTREDVAARVASMWEARAAAQDLKPGTVKYRRAEIDFACGAAAAIDASDDEKADESRLSERVPVCWVINPLCGMPVFDIKKES